MSALYLPLLILPWIITCLMMFRPVQKPSYIDQSGKYTDKDARDMKRWLTAAEVMGTIAVVIALPVISSLLAQAAVRYSQRRTEGQRLNLGQLLTLADRGWADVPLFLRSVKNVKFDSPLLWLGAVLMFIGELMMILN